MADGFEAPNYADLLDLSGRGFIVLGAGDGIGAQIALALRQAGAALVCVDVVPERAEAIARATEGHSCVADVTTAAGVAKVFEEAEAALGSIRGIVDVIGVARVKPLLEFSDDELEWQLGIVLRHALYTLRAAAKSMPRGGSITFVGSMSGDRAVQNQIVYGTSKAALHHLVRGAARELGPKGIRVNAVAPGFIKTPRLLQALDAGQWAEIDRCVPLGAAARPEEIASALLFLASDMASHVSGVVMPVDGGVSVSAALPSLRFGPQAAGR